MTPKEAEKTLRILADTTAHAQERAAAADALAADGLRVVMSKGNRGPETVEIDATIRMWAHPARLQTWGRRHLPIVEPHEALPSETYDLDPFDLTPLDDGYNSASGADWKGVKTKHRILVRWGVSHNKLSHVDPCELAAQLTKGKLSERLKRCQTEATKDGLAAAAAQLRGERRATAHLPQQEAAIRVGGVASGRAQVFRGPIGAVQTGSHNVANVSMSLASSHSRLHLGDFLADAFGDELRLFVGRYYPELSGEIAWGGSVQRVAWDVAGMLKRHGLVNEILREQLLIERPDRAADIARAMT